MIRNAHVHEAQELSRLAYASKAYWGYDPQFMASCEIEFNYGDKLAKETYCFRVLESQGEIRGFYALEKVSPLEVELEAMFVKPNYIGQGLGQQLMHDAKQHVKAMGATTLIIQSDPHAEAFYCAAGAEVVGLRPSNSIAGRHLPLLHLEL